MTKKSPFAKGERLHFAAGSYDPEADSAISDEGYSPAEIVELFESRGMQAHEVAMMVQLFWPTIKAALLAYSASTGDAKVKPIEVNL